MERERQARWDAENLHTASTKLMPGEYRILRDACDARGITVYALVKRLLRGWLMDYARDNPAAADALARRG